MILIVDTNRIIAALIKDSVSRSVIMSGKIELISLDFGKKEVDPDDTPFIAAALACNVDIWSDDEHFQKQKRIKTWKTKDIIKYLDMVRV